MDEHRLQVQAAYWLIPEVRQDARYSSWRDNGVSDVQFQDKTAPGFDNSIPWLLASLRTGDNSWIGFDYLSMGNEGIGKIKKYVRLGLFRFFVSAPTRESYQLDIGRIWYRYRIINDDTQLSMMFGLTAVQAKATVATEALGQESAEGILPMPTGGLMWQGNGPYATRWSVLGDYSGISHKGADGSIWNLTGSIERSFSHGFSVGVGLRSFQFRLRAQRSNYNASFKETVTAPFIFIQQSF